MKKTFTFVCGMLYAFSMFGQNQAPVVSNINTVFSEETNTFTIQYDLSDAENDDVTVVLQQKVGNGFFLTVETNVSGDVGEDISVGTDKIITYEFQGEPTNDIALRLFVYDSHTPTIQEMIDQVNQENLIGYIEDIMGPRSPSNYENLMTVENYLTNFLANNQLSNHNQSFVHGNKNYQNIIGNREGLNNNKLCLINGHFDGVPNYEAADDNASGVSATLEAARILSNYYFENNVQFCFFNLEELGLIGSKKYVQSGIASEHEIVGLINFDMIGYYSDEPNSQTLPTGFNLLFPDEAAEIEENDYRGDFIITSGASGSGDLLALFAQLAETHTPGLKVASLNLPGNGSLVSDLRRSDHAPFWDKGYPAIFLTDGADTRNPNYHTANDTIGSINFDIMEEVVKASIATLIEIAKPLNASAKEIDLTGLLGINEAISKDLIKIWPNPVEESLNITFVSQQDFKVEILSVEGKLISSKTYTNNPDNKYEINVSNLVKGNYLLQIKDEERSYQKRFMK